MDDQIHLARRHGLAVRCVSLHSGIAHRAGRAPGQVGAQPETNGGHAGFPLGKAVVPGEIQISHGDHPLSVPAITVNHIPPALHRTAVVRDFKKRTGHTAALHIPGAACKSSDLPEGGDRMTLLFGEWPSRFTKRRSGRRVLPFPAFAFAGEAVRRRYYLTAIYTG